LSGIGFEEERRRVSEEARYQQQQAQQLQEEMQVAAQADKPAPEKKMDTHLLGLQFLQPTPQKPTVKVLFDLGRGGRHLKRFHHYQKTDSLLVFLYDDRYDGDRFHPPFTEGEPITVALPDRAEEVFHVLVPRRPQLSFNVGCLDVLLLVIAPPELAVAEKQPEEMTDDELLQQREAIPTTWRQEEAALEQLIREGRLDLGSDGAAI
jgi:hypothetical protein